MSLAYKNNYIFLFGVNKQTRSHLLLHISLSFICIHLTSHYYFFNDFTNKITTHSLKTIEKHVDDSIFVYVIFSDKVHSLEYPHDRFKLFILGILCDDMEYIYRGIERKLMSLGGWLSF